MAKAARPVFCELNSTKPAVPVQKVRGSEASDSVKILLQPRLCTLRSYGSDRIGVMRSRKDGGDVDGSVSPFFAMLQEYIESSKKSEDFETISGRLAMIVFAATITMEEVTGNSLFRKMDVQGIAEAIGVCLGAVTCAAIFAWFSSARNRVGRMFTLSCNTFIDSLIDQIVDGLFYEGELGDWSDRDT
ncbi:Stress enhanced protein [Actinidia chinensis var. chinensis]|uniref:Stress enhanced protein n=1 Tax=Actinidia chinensis var. chinensis TaxID=1590841 RepID=A0A2R6S365_ACTCC|nr:Stress enhanced protein [Actinidia chinensis var. chinensis]